MEDVARQALRTIAEKHGSAVLLDAKRCRSLLLDRCPQARLEIRVLTDAIEEGIPRRLLDLPASTLSEAIVANHAARFGAATGRSSEIGRWAVESCAYALGLDVKPAQDQRSENPDNDQEQAATTSDQSRKPEQPADRGVVPPGPDRQRATDRSWRRPVIVGGATLAIALTIGLVVHVGRGQQVMATDEICQNGAVRAKVYNALGLGHQLAGLGYLSSDGKGGCLAWPPGDRTHPTATFRVFGRCCSDDKDFSVDVQER